MSYYGITGQPITTGNTYISNRKKWSHPQAMIWSRDPGTIIQSGAMTGVVEPRGTEGVDFVVRYFLLVLSLLRQLFKMMVLTLQ